MIVEAMPERVVALVYDRTVGEQWELPLEDLRATKRVEILVMRCCVRVCFVPQTPAREAGTGLQDLLEFVKGYRRGGLPLDEQDDAVAGEIRYYARGAGLSVEAAADLAEAESEYRMDAVRRLLA